MFRSAEQLKSEINEARLQVNEVWAKIEADPVELAILVDRAIIEVHLRYHWLELLLEAGVPEQDARRVAFRPGRVA